uniref:Maestro heat-like repeat-containing protein family member 1 n=1 Tax=Callorhinchus milii TaxID=7868 RepID=A0A4W3H1Y9_CALMI
MSEALLEELTGTENLREKDELLGYLQDFIRAEPRLQLKTPIRGAAMDACVRLLRLDPQSNPAESFELLQSCLQSVSGSLFEETSVSLQHLLNEVLWQDLSPRGLRTVFKHLEGWLVSGKDYERQRAMRAISELLSFFLKNLDPGKVVAYYSLESMIGRLVPRCADPLRPVRQMAMESLHALFCIQLRYEGYPTGQRNELVESLRVLKVQLSHSDNQVHFRTCSELANLIAKRLSYHQLTSLFPTLCEGLVDPNPTCCGAASVVINGLIRRCGVGFHEQVSEMLQILLGKMGTVTQEHVRFSVIHNIYLLASQNTPAVVSCLLSSSSSSRSDTREIWGTLAGDTDLTKDTLELLLDELDTFLEHEERKELLIGPLAITCALSEMLSNPDTFKAMGDLYPRLFSLLLVLLYSSVSKPSGQTPTPKGSLRERKLPTNAGHGDVSRYSIEMLQNLLTRARSERVVEAVKGAGGWDKLKTLETYHEGVASLAQAMVGLSSPHLTPIVENLAAILNVYHKHRLPVAAFFGELVRGRVDFNLSVTDTLVGSLLRCLADPRPLVRVLSVRGLGNMGLPDPVKTRRYSTRLLAAMTAVGREPDEPGAGPLLTLEALTGLSKVSAQLEEEDVRHVLVNVALAVRAFFASEDEEVRAEAVGVFGDLSRFAVAQSREVFVEQVHSSLVGLLLHLNDHSPRVVTRCKQTLQRLGGLMESDGLRSTFEAGLPQEAQLDYCSLLDMVTKFFAQDSPEKVNAYLMACLQVFKSPLPEIRGNAVMMVGFLLQNLPESLHTFGSTPTPKLLAWIHCLLPPSRPSSSIDRSPSCPHPPTHPRSPPFTPPPPP